jgi:hypothetical protein
LQSGTFGGGNGCNTGSVNDAGANMLRRTLLSLLALGFWPLTAGAIVTVAFESPGQFRDASLEGSYIVAADEPALREIGKHLQKLGERYLAPGETLAVEVLDVDLAGRFEPWRTHAYSVRFMDSITWPMIRVRYTLQRDGHTQMSAEERLIDQMYLAHQSTYFSNDRLRYEKRMLDHWFRTRFVEHVPPP